ncbi:MAG: glycosyltransferase, partial [Chthoniobacteraceae bacterium]
GLITPTSVPNRPRWGYRLMEHFEHTLPHRATLVTTCSGYLADLARNHGAPQTAVIHNGYWPGPAPADRATLRTEFNLKSDAFYLGFIGWTPSEVVWCLDALKQLGDNVRLASCGYDIRQNLGAYPGLRDRIDYLGKLSPDQARRLMHAINAGLLPLAHTPFNESRLPIKFADYLAAGVPAICGDVGEVGSLGRQIHGAILYPPEREAWVAGCVNAVNEIQRDPATHLPDTEELERHISWPHLVQQLEHAYLSNLERLNPQADDSKETPCFATSPAGERVPHSDTTF